MVDLTFDTTCDSCRMQDCCWPMLSWANFTPSSWSDRNEILRLKWFVMYTCQSNIDSADRSLSGRPQFIRDPFLWTDDPLYRDPLDRDPLDRDPLDRDPLVRDPTLTEITLDRDPQDSIPPRQISPRQRIPGQRPHLDSDPPGQRPLDRDPWTDIPRQRPPVQRLPGQRPLDMRTETSLWPETPWTETPRLRPPWTDPIWTETHWTEIPLDSCTFINKWPPKHVFY